MERSEEYFRELSNFRKQFPEEFYGNSERILDIPLQPSTREGVENDLELPPPNDTHIREWCIHSISNGNARIMILTLFSNKFLKALVTFP